MSGLTRSDINEILGFIDNSNFHELRIETGDLKIELRRAGHPGSPAVARETFHEPAPTAAVRPAAGPAPVENRDTGTTITAPMLGIFYHAPKPGADPFVKPGDLVTPGTVIGIIEVMKLMNQVEANVSGVVTEIVAPNGGLVEHGDALVRLRAA